MPTYSLLFALTPEDAIATAVEEYKWLHIDGLQHEFRRNDSLERIKFVPDGPARETLQNQRWGTRVYLGRNWNRRKDAYEIADKVVYQFFNLIPAADAVHQPARRRHQMTDTERDNIRRMWYR